MAQEWSTCCQGRPPALWSLRPRWQNEKTNCQNILWPPYVYHGRHNHTQIPTHGPPYVPPFSSEAFLSDSVDTKSCTKKFIQLKRHLQILKKSKVESPHHKQKMVLKQVSRPSESFPNLPLLCSPRELVAPTATSQFYCTWELKELFPAERSQDYRSLDCKELPVRGKMYCTNVQFSYEVKYKSKDFSKSRLGI